jgi:hypothetical protein
MGYLGAFHRSDGPYERLPTTDPETRLNPVYPHDHAAVAGVNFDMNGSVEILSK